MKKFVFFTKLAMRKIVILRIAPVLCIGATMLLAVPSAVYSQGLSFEVASIKPSLLPERGQIMHVGCSGGPLTQNPVRWTCEYLSLSDLVSIAFDLTDYELQTPPSLGNERFNIIANVPEGATKEQFKKMQQNLLIERFGLRFHREKKEMPGYALVIAKNGPKFKESGPEPPKDSDANSAAVGQLSLKFDKDGFPVIPPGRTQQIMIEQGPGGETGARGRWVQTPMQKIVAFITARLRKPVSDNTDLHGKYDISLSWASEPMGSAALPMPGEGSTLASEPSRPDSIFTALQEQLGLKLQPQKVMVDILVVDHIEKTPADN